jgi:putative Mn2+ efflux pump MntP
MKRHSTDVVSLVFGLLFMALAGWWAVAYYLDWTVNWNVPNFGWIAAGVLIVVGLFGVVASLRRDRPELAPAEGPGAFEQPTSAESPAEEPEKDDLASRDASTPTVDLGPVDSAPTDVRRDDRD